MAYPRTYLLLALLLGLLAPPSFAQESFWDKHVDPPLRTTTVTVYRDPSCNCCRLWMEHLSYHGFPVEDRPDSDMKGIKDRLGVPEGMRSCHTAVVDGYVIEGHVPALDIDRLLKERPSVRGLAVPGMVVGTPGMEHGPRKDPFTVLSFGEGTIAAKAEAKPAAKPSATEKPVAEKAEAKPETKPVAKPATDKAAAKPSATEKPVAEKAEAKLEAKPETKPVAKPEAKPEAKPAEKAPSEKGSPEKAPLSAPGIFHEYQNY
jgi:hypothetical protein